MNEQAKAWLKNIASYSVILFVSATYIATSFITLERSGKTVWQIIIDGIFVFVVGILINRAFEFQGILEGERDEQLRTEENHHAQEVDKVAPIIDVLEEWCMMKNAEALKIQRVRILAEKGMKYSDYFDEEGMALPFKINQEAMNNRYTRKIERMRIKCYTKALSVHLTPLSAAVLTGESGRYWDPYFLGRSKAEYTKESGKSDVIIKILLAFAFGYFAVSLITDWSIANLIWKVFQIAVFLCMGHQKQLRSRAFVTGEFKDRIMKKIKYLKMFEPWGKAFQKGGNK